MDSAYISQNTYTGSPDIPSRYREGVAAACLFPDFYQVQEARPSFYMEWTMSARAPVTRDLSSHAPATRSDGRDALPGGVGEAGDSQVPVVVDAAEFEL